MNLSAKKSSIHHHLTRAVLKKAAGSRNVNADDNASRINSGFGKLEIGTEVLPVPAAYKPIFRF